MVQFATRLERDGSLRVPQSALDDLGLQPGDAVQVSLDTASGAEVQTPSEEAQGQIRFEKAVRAMTNRTPEQIADAQARSMSQYLPKRTVPPGKTLADEVAGQWPGDETDAQIEAALVELS